mmetsp:Transcript_18042/g.63359  ORF Transcript_18042/g.63359 Transcript_18042/m.63359 type:complete len:226 (-) Transcript_18042:668-1345(-)
MPNLRLNLATFVQTRPRRQNHGAATPTLPATRPRPTDHPWSPANNQSRPERGSEAEHHRRTAHRRQDSSQDCSPKNRRQDQPRRHRKTNHRWRGRNSVRPRNPGVHRLPPPPRLPPNRLPRLPRLQARLPGVPCRAYCVCCRPVSCRHRRCRTRAPPTNRSWRRRSRSSLVLAKRPSWSWRPTARSRMQSSHRHATLPLDHRPCDDVLCWLESDSGSGFDCASAW